jgi:Protein of unknown function (DUF2877)
VPVLPSAADVVLAGLLDSPPRAARVVLATPLAAYARCGDVLVGVLAPTAVRVPGGLVVPPELVRAQRPGGELLVGGGTVVASGIQLAVRRWWDSAVPRIRPVPQPPALPRAGGVPDDVRAGAIVLHESLGDGSGLREAVRGLVGLGPGLTPAGDDVVAAALVALIVGGAFERAGAVLDAVRSCLHRTTDLSAALLEHAGAARAVPQLARYLRAPADPGALAGLLAVGGTSGAALVLGAEVGLSCASSSAAATMASPGDREAA